MGTGCLDRRLIMGLVALAGVGSTPRVTSGASSAKASSLVDVVLFGIPPVSEWRSTPGRPTDPCVDRYLGSIPPASPLWIMPLPSTPDEALPHRRRYLAEQAVALLGPEARSEAESFAAAVSLRVEWEGTSEGPIEEADSAARYLAGRPGSLLVPFSDLFQAHRLRAAWEAAAAGGGEDRRADLGRRYRESLERARSASNPLVSCIAGALEWQDHVYLGGVGRP